MSIIEKYPSIFHVGGVSGKQLPFVTLTRKAKKIASEEGAIGKDFNGRAYLYLENWDSLLAMTACEERFACEGVLASAVGLKKVRIMKDGNYLGPFAFKMCFAAGFRLNEIYLEELQRWRKMEFPSPYLNVRRFDVAALKTRKRVLVVLHELLSLTMEKRMTSALLDAFHSEYLLPSKLVLCLTKHHGIFYITNKGARSTIFLKEAYDGTRLVDKCPMLMFNDKFVALNGRKEINSFNSMNSSQVVT
ncbi:Plant organelle RNA recognition domain - like 10 [Theobroma cacao]|nr:Plant organelle RNA recognition domain - like 10 [Theobroma cacao]